MTNKPILIDIMERGHFLYQLKYEGMPFPEMIDGKIVPVYNLKEIEKFVYSQRPSLIGRDIRIEFSNQKA